MAPGLLQKLRGLATSPRHARRSESTVELLEFEAERKLWLENVTRGMSKRPPSDHTPLYHHYPHPHHTHHEHLNLVIGAHIFTYK